MNWNVIFCGIITTDNQKNLIIIQWNINAETHIEIGVAPKIHEFKMRKYKRPLLCRIFKTIINIFPFRQSTFIYLCTLQTILSSALSRYQGIERCEFIQVSFAWHLSTCQGDDIDWRFYLFCSIVSSHDQVGKFFLEITKLVTARSTSLKAIHCDHLSQSMQSIILSSTTVSTMATLNKTINTLNKIYLYLSIYKEKKCWKCTYPHNCRMTNTLICSLFAGWD